MTELTIPIPPAYVFGVLWLLGIGAASALIVWGLPRKDGDNGLGKVAAMFGLTKPPAHLVVIGAIIWCLIFALLVIGILSAIHDLIVHPFTAMPAEANWLSTLLGIAPPASDWRYALFKLTALTATTGVVVTLPFTLIRLRLSNEANDNAAATLFNEKFKAASEALSARRTVTFTARNVTWEADGETHSHLEREDTPFTPPEGATAIARSPWTIHSIEEPDIVTRSTAIDQIEQLVHERPEEAPRVANLLSIYVREHTAEAPPEEHPRTKWLKLLEGDENTAPLTAIEIYTRHKIHPEDVTLEKYLEWASSLKPKRNDVQKAAQSLGRLKKIEGVAVANIKIDLRGANMQGFELSMANYSDSLLDDCRMEGTSLDSSDLSRSSLSGTNLVTAVLHGATCLEITAHHLNAVKANFRLARFQSADFFSAKLPLAVFDGSQMQDVDMYGADLERANLRGADLRGARLVEVDLTGADLSEARLESASLDLAVLKGVQLSLAKMDQSTSLRYTELLGAGVSHLDPETAERLYQFKDDIFADYETARQFSFRPNHWLRHSDDDFVPQWHAWQETLPDFDPSWRGE